MQYCRQCHARLSLWAMGDAFRTMLGHAQGLRGQIPRGGGAPPPPPEE